MPLGLSFAAPRQFQLIGQINHGASIAYQKVSSMLTLSQSHIEAIFGTVNKALDSGILIRRPEPNERPNVIIVNDTTRRH